MRHPKKTAGVGVTQLQAMTFCPMATQLETINISINETHICKTPLRTTNIVLHPAETNPYIGTATKDVTMLRTDSNHAQRHACFASRELRKKTVIIRITIPETCSKVPWHRE
jgi:hypothetical protein